eukprot:11374093-Karenia_brevis.AAC.1
MANPKVVSWRALKRVARYLVGVERVVWKFKWQEEVKFSRVLSDRDLGGDVRDRKSTSGGVWMPGGGALHQDLECNTRGHMHSVVLRLNCMPWLKE